MSTHPNIIPIAQAVPHNETAERAAISAILQNFDLLTLMSWPEDYFFTPAYRTILATVKDLHSAGAKTDLYAVQARLEQTGEIDAVGGHHELIALQMHMPTGDPGIAGWHRDTLADAARYRRALTAVRKAEADFMRQEGDIAAVSLALADAAASGTTATESTKDILNRLVDELEKNEPAEAFGTGLSLMDEITTGGVKRGELATIGAPTSGGKSILLLQIALQAIRAGKHVAIFSLEMSATQVMSRLISAVCGFNVAALRYNKTKGDMDAFKAAMRELKQAKLTVISGTSAMDDIDGQIRELVAKGKCDLAVVDYLQLVHLRAMASNETREQHVSEITRRLKAIALQLNIAMATASQLNEEGKLRESRAIGMHSDHVWIIRHGDESFVTVDKNRDGERGAAIPVLMQGAFAQFLPRQEEPKTSKSK